ncbi:MAG: hypothetical protein QOG65_1425 [Actinomycetota bacterium]|nr:hypothetical protein [Actinomycetota bacterium]
MERKAFGEMAPGTELGPFRVTVSAAANERYWRAAGVDHPALAAGALYPPIAANLTVLCFGRVCPDAMIQTRQHLRCHRKVAAGVELVTTGKVSRRYEKRGRTYVDVETMVATADRPDEAVWSSEVSFTPAATVGFAS